MRIKYQISKKCAVEVEGKDIKEVFAELHKVVECLGEAECGCCKSTNIKPVARKSDSYTFYEIACSDCYAVLSLGQGKTGDLYPRRRYHDKAVLVKEGKAKEGEFIPNNGWQKGFGKREE